jgi:hypothetical protein
MASSLLGGRIISRGWQFVKTSIPLPSFDALALSSVAFVAAGTLVYANDQGSYPLSLQVGGSECKYDFSPGRLELSPERCRKLETEGYLVIDDFLSTEELSEAVDSASRLESCRPEEAEGENKVAARFMGLRTGSILYFDRDYIGATELRGNSGSRYRGKDEENGLWHIRHLLRGIAHAVEESDFRGFEQSKKGEGFLDYTSNDGWIGVPETIQSARYEPLTRKCDIEDTSASIKEASSNYNHAHRDACTQPFADQGLLGYLGSLYLRKRYLTGIVYLNETNGNAGSAEGPWREEDGGQLHLFIGADASDNTGASILQNEKKREKSRLVSIEPRGGRLVLLSSEHVLHQVQSSFRSRVACSIWLTLN